MTIDIGHCTLHIGHWTFGQIIQGSQLFSSQSQLQPCHMPPPLITVRRPSQTCQQLEQHCLQGDSYPKCTDLPSQPTTTIPTSTNDQAESSALTCFCGYYSEKVEEHRQTNVGRGRKVGQCPNVDFNSFTSKDTHPEKPFSDRPL